MDSSHAKTLDAKTSNAKTLDAKTSNAKISDAKTSDAETLDAKTPDDIWKNFANHIQIVDPDRLKPYLGQSCNSRFFKRFFKTPKATRNLRIAAKLGKTDMVKLLLALERTDVNNTDKACQTALHYAAREGHLEIVNILLERKNIDATLCNRVGNTALHNAAKHGDIRVFNRILEAPKVNPNSINKFGETPCILAAQRGHEKIVDILSKLAEHHENAPPCETTKHGPVDIVKKILTMKMDVNATNRRKQSPPDFGGDNGDETLDDTSKGPNSTPLHAAAEYGHANIIKKLLEEVDVDVNSTIHSEKKSPLHLAVEGEYETVVGLLLRKGTVDPSLKDSSGNTPLHYAAKAGNEAIFEMLLNTSKVEVTSSNNKGMTALHIAAKYKHANIVTMLLEKPNVDPHAKTMAKEKTPLRMASKFGGVDVVHVLLENPKVDPNLGDNDKNTPLHLAAKFGHRDVVERLLAVLQSDKVNTPNKQNETPLFLASKYGSIHVVDLLLGHPKVNREVDLSFHDEHGDSPFHIAVKGGHVEIAKKLITHPRAFPILANKENMTGLHLCTRGGYENLVDMLLELSPQDANAKDAWDNFPIHYAAENGNICIFQKILNAPGVDENNVNSVNDHLETPLHIAIKAGHVDIVEILLQLPTVDASMRDRDGNPPLHVAAKYDEEEMIEKLLQVDGVDVNAENEGGITALVLAAKEGHETFVKELLKNQNVLSSTKEGQGEHLKNNWGVRSLLYAARNGHEDIVKDLLLSHDINVNGTHPSFHSTIQGAVQGFRHKTALSEAIEHGRKKVVEVLLDHATNIDPNRRNENGEHPLFIAAKHGHKDIIEKLLNKSKKGLIDVNVLSNGKTALQGAALAGKEQVVEYLLKAPDIDVHIRNAYDGESALFYAARANNKTILKKIYEASKVNVESEKNIVPVSVNDMNNKGESIIHLAAQEKLFNVLDFLLEVDHDDARGVDVNLKTSPPEGEEHAKSALQIAMKAAQEAADAAKKAAKDAANVAKEVNAAKVATIKAIKEAIKKKVAEEATNKATIKAKCYEVIEKLMKFDSINFIQEKEGKAFLQEIFKQKEWETFSVVMTAPQVTAYIDALYKDRQASVDAANAILVGAALIAGVTFASWLQPPLGYSTYYHEQLLDSFPAPPVTYPEYVAFDHYPSLQAFWVFNSLSFFSAIATVICGARSVLPDEKLFIKQEVENLRQNLLRTSVLLGFSMFFVLLAFAIAGVVVLPPLIKFRANIFSTIAIGGSVCFMFLFLFGKSIRKLNLNIKSSQENNSID